MGNSQTNFDQRLVDIEIELNKHENKKYNLDLIKLIYNNILTDVLKHLNSINDNISFNDNTNLLGIKYNNDIDQQRLEKMFSTID